MPNSDELKYKKYTPSSSPHSIEGQLLGGDMLWLRRMVREEVRAALHEHVSTLFQNVISEPKDETEEMAAVLVTLSSEQWEALIERVDKERKGIE